MLLYKFFDIFGVFLINHLLTLAISLFIGKFTIAIAANYAIIYIVGKVWRRFIPV